MRSANDGTRGSEKMMVTNDSTNTHHTYRRYSLQCWLYTPVNFLHFPIHLHTHYPSFTHASDSVSLEQSVDRELQSMHHLFFMRKQTPPPSFFPESSDERSAVEEPCSSDAKH